jgi:DNA topoisomerase-3
MLRILFYFHVPLSLWFLQGYETVAEIEIQEEGFVTSGLQIVARNYLEVYPYERWSDRSLPQLNEGQRFIV